MACLTRVRKCRQIAADVLLINLSVVLALLLRFTPEPVPAECWRLYLVGVGPLVILRLLCLWRLRLYPIHWRTIGSREVIRVVQAVTASSFLFACGLWATGERSFPRGVLVIEWLLASLFLGGLRLSLHGSAALRAGLVREIAPEYLLRRPPVRIDLASIADYLQGERVLVTGAGGSIGSELVRQVLGFSPEQVLLLGRGENSIFEVQQQLAPGDLARVVPLIADVRDRDRLEQIFRRYRPTVVFHAAAHKHVPLMESNPEEAVKNNVLGTRHLLELAGASDVRRFVLISSDKAVNPASVMGSTKRIAEMLLQVQAQITPGTRFMAVRFGNVLGSRGSFVVTMLRQIAEGRPVTVTHPEMVRYFMTVREAVQLVIQAGALGSGGEIFVLDMGEPVRILELAQEVIRLSGFLPETEIPIQITGVRPGEKLYEELLTAGEGLQATRCSSLLTARPPVPDPEWLQERVGALVRAAERGRVGELPGLLAQIVPEYRNPQAARREPQLSPPLGHGNRSP